MLFDDLSRNKKSTTFNTSGWKCVLTIKEPFLMYVVQCSLKQKVPITNKKTKWMLPLCLRLV